MEKIGTFTDFLRCNTAAFDAVFFDIDGTLTKGKASLPGAERLFEYLHGGHPASSRLTAFVGMQSPATPDVFIREVHPGDRILLCSDGLYGMTEERELARIMRSSRSPDRICQRLIDSANAHGGCDNIAAVYLQITA